LKCSTLQKARENAIKAINTDLVKANLEIGRHIVEFEQQGKEKADYGSALLTNLAKDLKTKYCKGFSKSKYLPVQVVLYQVSKIPDSIWKIELEPLC
jgi:DUF1016 N-terminal domain